MRVAFAPGGRQGRAPTLPPVTGSWAQANLPINQFNPTNLDCDQWATAAASAKMKFGVLTTRHHDGFALWPSKA